MTVLVPSQKPVVIALHGAVMNSGVWLPLQRELGDTVEFIAPDLPGHGTRRDMPFRIDLALTLIADCVPQGTQNSERPVLLIGDSLGGYLALIAASRLGVRVSGVVAGGCTFPMHGGWSIPARLTDLPVQLAQMFTGRERIDGAMTALLRRIADTETADLTAAKGVRYDGRSESIDALSGFDTTAAIAEITAPIYFVNGALDIPAAWFTRRYASLAHEGYAVTIPNAWHGCMLTHPRECAEVVRTAAIRIGRTVAQNMRRADRS